MVDAAQLVPHRRTDIERLGVDYVALSGHKRHVPYGAGVLAGRVDWLDAAPPYLLAGGAVHDVSLDGVSWARRHRRHEGGTPNLLGAVVLAAACDALAGLPAGALEAHEEGLRTRLAGGLDALPGVDVLRMWPDCPGAIGVVSFAVDGGPAELVSEHLAAAHGIGVRDGGFCAHPLLRRLGRPAGAVRASLGAGSTSDDVERLLAGVEELAGLRTALAVAACAVRRARARATPSPRG